MESAREIFNNCCAEIATPLAESGFQYYPSKHTARRTCGDLKFEIHFQSSSRNYLAPNDGASILKRVASKLMPLGDLVTFGSVTLIEHASVRSKMMKAFRKTLHNGWTLDDYVTGGQIGNLRSPARWVTFNLANPHTRSGTVSKARQLIETVALPHFELFNNPPDVIARLLDGSIQWMWESSALEYVCCFGSVGQANQLLNKLIDEGPDRRAEYRDTLLRYRSDGVPEAWGSGAPERLAKTAIILELEAP